MILELMFSVLLPRNFDKPRERFFKSKAPNIYKNKFYIDYYNFTHLCEDYLAIFRITNYNKVLFVIDYLRIRPMY